MKKNLKRFLGAALAASMMLGMASISAYADPTTADTYSITVNDTTTGRDYKAYQIFTGEFTDVDGDVVLTEAEWGDGISDAGKAALDTEQDAQAGAEFAASKSGSELAALLADKLVASNAISATANAGTYVFSGLAAGYYFVTAGENESGYILKVVNEDVEAYPKAGAPTVVKKVKDINDSNDSSMSDWLDAADHDINDVVPFKLEATLPDSIDNFTSYRVKFVDTLSKGLTLAEDSITVTCGGETLTKDTDYKVIVTDKGEEGTGITIIVKDAKAAGANGKVIVNYNARLNEDAVIGSEGNPNVVKLKYTTDFEYDADNDDDWNKDEDSTSDNPDDHGDGKDDNDHDREGGETENDKVIVFTYKVVIDKVDENERPLTGAKFKLEKVVAGEANPVLVKEFTVTDEGQTSFEFEGIDDGTYRLTETETPAGYNSIEPVEFEVTASHTGEQVAGTYDATNEAAAPALIELSGDNDEGLIEFTVDAVNDDALTANVVNQKGAILPSTGGMGTKVLYGAGGAMVLVAGVLFVTRGGRGKDK